MVIILSEYKEGFTGANCKIPSGPLYKNIMEVIDIASISLATTQCRKDVAALGKDHSAMRDSIKLAVRTGRFIGSEWCQLNSKGAWAACDAYSYSEKVWIDAARKEMNCDFYIKFCIGKTGAVVITVSHHLPRQR